MIPSLQNSKARKLRSSGLVLGLALVLLPALLLAQNGSDAAEEPDQLGGLMAAGPGGGPGGGGGLWGDDTIGTLPIHCDDDDDITFGFVDAMVAIGTPSIYLQGRLSDAQGIIQWAQGDGEVYIEQLDFAADPLVRLTFVGDVSIDLDRRQFRSDALEFGLFSGLDFGRSLVRFSLTGTIVPGSVLMPGTSYPVDLHGFDTFGLLDQGPLDITILGSNGKTVDMRARAQFDRLILAQN